MVRKLLLTILIAVAIFIIDIKAEGDRIIYVNTVFPNASNTSSCWEGKETTPCTSIDLGLYGIQTWLKENEYNTATLMIAGGVTYQINDSTLTQFTFISGLTISGYGSDLDGSSSVATLHCGPSVGFSFIRSRKIIFRNIIFDGCGELHNSTSYNLDTSNPNYCQFVASLYFLYCKDISFESIKVENTLGMGVMIFNTIGNISINNSNFTNNTFQPESDLSGGGGLYIEFSYCDPYNLSCLLSDISNVDLIYTKNALYTITNTVFLHNRANISYSNLSSGTYILPIGKDHSAFGRGGGLSAYIIGQATDIRINLKNCSFIGNTALWGAGLLVEFHDSAHHNYLVVEDSKFIDNSLYYDESLNEGTGGGGARVAMFMFFVNDSIIYSNNVIFAGCTFSRNNAYYGGGLSFYTSVNSPNYPVNQLQLFDCSFTENKARLGAAIDLSIYHPSIDGTHPKVLIHNLIVHKNIALFHGGQPGTIVGIGTVYIDTLAVQFAGTITFEDNNGSALALTGSCQVDILNNSKMEFTRNLGRNGGGLVIYGNAFIVTHANSSLVFINNTAEYHGGAIYHYTSGERDRFGSGNCFIRYFDIFRTPQEWTSTFYFESNKANNYDNAIYSSMILPCVWGGAQGSTNTSDAQIKEVFCWNKNWHYRNSSNYSVDCYKQIFTAPSSFKIGSIYHSIPGQTIFLNVSVFDDIGNPVTNKTVFILRIHNSSASFTGNGTSSNYMYVSHRRVNLFGQPNSKVKVQVETDDSVVIENQIEVILKPCPPGFYYSGSNDSSAQECLCDDNYNGYIRCDQSDYSSSILRLGWIGTVPGFGKTLLFGFSPYFSTLNQRQFIPLPQDPGDLSDFLCNSTNSEGVLCGKCKDGYGVAADIVESACVPCSPNSLQYSWIWYILTEFVPVTLFFAVVFIFSMTVTFGPLNSYIFFAQVITTVMKVYGNGVIPVQTITKASTALTDIFMIPYRVWNMDFFRSILPRYCLNPNWSTLTVLNISYLQAIYPIFLLLILVVIMTLYSRGVPVIVCLCRPLHRCLARFRQWSNLRQSITGGMAVFVVVSYMKHLLVAFYILTPEQLIYSNGSKAAKVFYFDGNIFFNQAYISYMIPSVIVLILATIPPFVLVYPTCLRIIWHLSCRRLPLARLYPSLKLQAFLDEFHGCYKDGSNEGVDCRWFAGFYFFIRIALVTMCTQVNTLSEQYTMQVLLFLGAAILFLVFQPYRKSWINQLDVIMFLLLAAISSLSMYNVSMTLTDRPLSSEVYALQYILILLPLVYCIGYYLSLFCSKIKPKWFRSRRHTRQRNRVEPPRPYLSDNDSFTGSDFNASQRSSLEDSSHVPNFLDFVENTGRTGHQVRLTNPHRWNPSETPREDGGNNERTPLVTPVASNSNSMGDLNNDNSVSSYVRSKGSSSDYVRHSSVPAGSKTPTSTLKYGATESSNEI